MAPDLLLEPTTRNFSVTTARLRSLAEPTLETEDRGSRWKTENQQVWSTKITQRRTSMELPEAEKKEVLQDTLNECVLTPSIGQEGRDCYQPYRDGTFPSDKQEFGSALDVACECSHSKGDETPPSSPGELQECCRAPSSLHRDQHWRNS
ncbi:neuroblastoma breakpoint family member 11-like isoform X2 [Prionailurus viverrinus]|uniref:neuroblastoma breakpoint family member 11-like isoform X2 n=1 Tax=Prionailurus viverrinus TaxID=61388 RepID=UPI001FF16DB3|nr:neuroblastoma breakpoint family member 11-like isoform X2 [Prionailurus viverrinus]